MSITKRGKHQIAHTSINTVDNVQETQQYLCPLTEKDIILGLTPKYHRAGAHGIVITHWVWVYVYRAS